MQADTTRLLTRTALHTFNRTHDQSFPYAVPYAQLIMQGGGLMMHLLASNGSLPLQPANNNSADAQQSKDNRSHSSRAHQVTQTSQSQQDHEAQTALPNNSSRLQLGQRWLLFMRHCSSCNQDNCEHGRRCKGGRALWSHMINCKAGSACKFPRCVLVKQLLKHHKKCKDLHCQLCIPVKRYVHRVRVQQQTPAGEKEGSEPPITSPSTASSTAVTRVSQQQQQTPQIYHLPAHSAVTPSVPYPHHYTHQAHQATSVPTGVYVPYPGTVSAYGMHAAQPIQQTGWVPNAPLVLGHLPPTLLPFPPSNSMSQPASQQGVQHVSYSQPSPHEGISPAWIISATHAAAHMTSNDHLPDPRLQHRAMQQGAGPPQHVQETNGNSHVMMS